jgi:hypothetical protein
MKNAARQELLAVLAELSAASSEMRFGQLIANLATLARGLSTEGLWDAEDSELLDESREQLRYFAEHRVGVAVTEVMSGKVAPSRGATTIV